MTGTADSLMMTDTTSASAFEWRIVRFWVLYILFGGSSGTCIPCLYGTLHVLEAAKTGSWARMMYMRICCTHLSVQIKGCGIVFFYQWIVSRSGTSWSAGCHCRFNCSAERLDRLFSISVLHSKPLHVKMHHDWRCNSACGGQI